MNENETLLIPFTMNELTLVIKALGVRGDMLIDDENAYIANSAVNCLRLGDRLKNTKSDWLAFTKGV